MMQFAGMGAGVVLAAAVSVHGGVVDPVLEDVLEGTAADEVVSSIMYLGERVDLGGLTQALDAQHARLHTRHQVVVLELQDTAARTQGGLIAELEAGVEGGVVRRFDAFWIANAIRVDALPAEIRRLAARPDVERAFLNYPIESIRPVEEEGDAEGGIAGGPEPGLDAIRAPEVWAIGITGAGTLVSTLDTGVDGNHPALASRWRGLDPDYAANPEWAFFDPVTNQTFPFDSGDHGTHTMGSVCGGGPGDQVGVAPGAQWIHAAVIDRVSIDQTVSDAILSFQWLLDPDENPFTNDDVPDVNSNSWGLADVHGVPDCDTLFWSFLDACEAGGIVMVFAAGNEGFTGLRRPADRATDDYRTFSVAALDGNSPSLPIAGFSSRGPTFCTPGGGAAVKPDIAGPGVSVRSSLPGGGYGLKSGTSMSTPHLCGVVALMREANPEISVEQIKQIMYDTATDLGAPGDDNDFGHGIVDAFEAVQMALSAVTLTYTFPEGLPDLVDPNGGVTTIPVVISGDENQPVPGSGRIHVRVGEGTFIEMEMIETGPNEYEAVFADMPCGALVEYYFSVEADSGDTVTSPFSAPDVAYSSDVYSGLAVGYLDDGEGDPGWTVTNGPGLTDGSWDRGDPVGGGDRGDPPVDGDGSGQCWLTDNVDDNSDVDEGSTTLTSPVLDATTVADPSISYWRWYHNSFGDGPFSDVFVVDVSDDGGTTWTNLETIGPSGPEVSGGWIRASHRIADFVNVTDQFRIRFTASDTDPQSVVEAGVDGLEISALFCDGDTPCPADLNGDNQVNVLDLVDLILNWGPCPGCPADLNDDATVDVQDMVALITAWGTCE